MGHVKDRWTAPGANGRRVHNDRWGKGRRWQARWTDRAGREHARTFSTKDAADAHLRTVDTGVFTHNSQRLTFRAYADSWLESQLHHREQTAESTDRVFRNLLMPQLGDKMLTEVSRGDVQSAVTAWSKTYAPSKVHIAYGYVATLYRHAIEDRLVQFSPCVRISLPPDDRPSLIPLASSQVQTIIGRLPKHYRQMGILDAATGLRQGELRGLTLDRVLDGGATLRIDRQLIRHVGERPVFGPPKSSAGVRTLHISDIAQQAIKDHLSEFDPGPEGLLFTGRTHRPLDRKDLSAVWRNATDGMGLRERSGWHDFRHYCASVLISAGLSVRAVADWLGHKDPAETLRTYSHWFPADQERIRFAIDAQLDGLFGSEKIDGPETDQNH